MRMFIASGFMDDAQPHNLQDAQQLIDALRETNQQLSATNQQLTDTVNQQQSQIAWLTRQMFGRKSERLTGEDQPVLFDGSDDDTASSSTPASTSTQTVTYERHAGERGKRTPIPDDLPRVDRIHDLPDDEKKGLKWIGQQVSEQLEIEPGKVYVVRHVRYTYARADENLDPNSDESNVVTAAKPEEGLPRCIAGPTLLAYVMVSRFADHLPWHRQERMLKRSGVVIPRSSMCRWGQDLDGLVTPVMRLMKQGVLGSHVIQADETPVKQQVKGRGRTKTCYFYSYIGDEAGPYVLYDYQGGRSRAGPNGWFTDAQGEATYHGLLQCDAYTGYHDLFDSGKPWRMTPVACWAHVRRKFYDVRGDFPAPCHHALGQIRQLYDIERQAAADDLDAHERQQMRDEKSRPIVEAFMQWCAEQQPQTLPKSGLGEALQYALNQADALRRFLDDGQLELDNNRCERSLRGIAIGRKNWIFTGSDAGGRAAATMFSLIASAQRHGVEPLAYLTDLFRRLPATPTSQLDQFLPDRWQNPNA